MLSSVKKQHGKSKFLLYYNQILSVKYNQEKLTYVSYMFKISKNTYLADQGSIHVFFKE